MFGYRVVNRVLNIPFLYVAFCLVRIGMVAGRWFGMRPALRACVFSSCASQMCLCAYGGFYPFARAFE